MESLVSLLKKTGPLTGKEIVSKTGMEVFEAWKKCAELDCLDNIIVGKRYLRLDAKVEGYARLSPSIMREFLNYTVIGHRFDYSKTVEKAEFLVQESIAISENKINLAKDIVKRLFQNGSDFKTISSRICFIIAGDVVFGMAHREPRPEVSTGELVRGSDLDIIAVSEGLTEDLKTNIDSYLYREKYNLLMNPALKEELDYIVKDISAVVEQLKFDDFKKMVAAKILNEGLYLAGSNLIFNKIKAMLVQNRIPAKLSDLENKAALDRLEAEKTLLSVADEKDYEELMALFYTTEEKEEIF